jgi:hypothetical protein
MIAVEYPTTARGEPARLSAAQVYDVAASVRRQIGGVPRKPLALEAIVGRTASVAVNGRRLRLAWETENEVRDDEGRRVLGACIHDPVGPQNAVTIQINGEYLKGRPEVMRSTAMHELAHAIFDVPSALGESRRVFRTAAEPRAAKGITVLDWSEWRANEFMGGFLVPWGSLAGAVAAQAAALGLRFRWRDRAGQAMPALEAEPQDERVGWLLDHLAEAFGVTPRFMATRLRKGRLFDPSRERAR